MDKLSEIVGKRIRMYRKSKNITLNDLSKNVYKSVSTLSKYEKGEIAMDLDTLHQISKALDVSVYQLIDIDETKKEDLNKNRSNFIFDKLYVYWFNGIKNKVYNSVIEINYTNKKAIMYINPIIPDDYSSSNYICYGDIQITDLITNLYLRNQNNSLDYCIISFFNPMGNFEYVFGMFQGITYPYIPSSVKCVISKKELEINDELKKMLVLTKEDLKKIKSRNMFILD